VTDIRKLHEMVWELRVEINNTWASPTQTDCFRYMKCIECLHGRPAMTQAKVDAAALLPKYKSSSEEQFALLGRAILRDLH